MIVLKLYCPAVSQICSFTLRLFTVKVLNLKSTPIVAKRSSLNLSSTNRVIKALLPTLELPTMTTLNSSSYSLYDFVMELKKI
jgi:hypothetical protein